METYKKPNMWVIVNYFIKSIKNSLSLKFPYPFQRDCNPCLFQKKSQFSIFNSQLILLFAGLLMASSCINEMVIDDVIRHKDKGGAKFVLRFRTQDAFSEPEIKTRSLTVEQENAINNIYVLAFDSSGKLAAIRQGQDVTSITGHTNPAYSGEGSFSVILETSATTADTYNLVVFANAETILSGTVGTDDTSPFIGQNYNDVTAVIYDAVGGKMYPAGGVIPLWG
jgi:hypothetical protein